MGALCIIGRKGRLLVAGDLNARCPDGIVEDSQCGLRGYINVT